MKKSNYVILALSLLLCCFDLKAEDGSRLWLRAEKNAQQVQPQVKLKGKKDATLQIARDEILQYWKGKKVLLCVTKDGKTSDGFDIFDDGKAIHVESATSLGVLYGAYTLLRMQAMDQALQGRVSETPCYDIRILNHWDNPNGTVERGFAGRSIFWKDGAQSQRSHVDATPNQVDGLTGASALLDETDKASSKKVQLSPEEMVWKAYARANASIGINATVLNNVNAKPLMLGEEKLQETKRIADVLRPYGIKVYLSVNFASPKALGGLPTADPLDKDVRQWWKDKADEIYRLIPDFGGRWIMDALMWMERICLPRHLLLMTVLSCGVHLSIQLREATVPLKLWRSLCHTMASLPTMSSSRLRMVLWISNRANLSLLFSCR